MKFNFKATLQDPVSGNTVNINPTVEFGKSAFSYGNGFHAILSRGGQIIQQFDLRYDSALDPDDLESYAEKLIRRYWSGKCGSWRVTNLLLTCY